jgi:serine/threonine protein kinase
MRHYAPEAIADKSNYTYKSDVYSFGNLLFELWQGRQLYKELSTGEACKNVLEGKRPPFTVHRFYFLEILNQINIKIIRPIVL